MAVNKRGLKSIKIAFEDKLTAVRREGGRGTG